MAWPFVSPTDEMDCRFLGLGVAATGAPLVVTSGGLVCAEGAGG